MVEDMPDILCDHIFKDLPDSPRERERERERERGLVLKEEEETFRIFYKMAEEILTLKQNKERELARRLKLLGTKTSAGKLA